ncbi:SURF1 family cytochrome oxidase biogenesis protein [Granulicoccus phenolivorans]|uniref:SURF1 family cytochrome oxidase biogenesis protein n=1 Tax=Granulicoccus phenolivorans TaxID=266854 RepID=UPI000429D6D3|nr:SURF1 family protein [Granulicoccus phenolivorans]
MSRTVRRWVALILFATVLVIAMINLGEWQLRRLDERRAANQVVVTNSNNPPISYRDVMGGEVTDQMQWQRVTATGTFTGEQFQIRYRVVNGEDGYEVVAPLRTTQGDLILVDRGLAPVPSGERLPDTLPAAPTGQVTVTGYLRRSEHGNDNAINPIDHRMRLINAPAIGAAMGQPVLDGYVAQTDIVPAGDGTLKPFVTPELSEGNHFSYALQWFTFSAIAVFGAVYFIRSDLKDRRKRRAATAAAAEQPHRV